MTSTVYLTTSLPYVNAVPHLGHALEFVQADVLARHHRLRGRQVRLLSGTDDNALKNVSAAQEAGLDPGAFIAGNAAAFRRLQERLHVVTDDFLHTGTDPRHRRGVERLWRQCAAHRDLYRRAYTGLYCSGCEQFYPAAELPDGRCPEHQIPADVVTEQNWFFRLSAYATEIAAALRTGRVRVEPEERRNEVLAWVESGLEDISVSRPVRRAQGWGIPVPGDDSQVVYVWWDALCSYVTALGYGGDPADATGDPTGSDYQRWWCASDARVHLVGKGIIRFHAVYWLALLLSAGQPLPTAVLVHDYLTVDGAKISKSSGHALAPTDLLDRYGTDAVRWWLCSDVARVGDTDFTEDRLTRRYTQDLAGGFGNVINRTCAVVTQFRAGALQPDQADVTGTLHTAAQQLPGRVDAALGRFDLRGACAALTELVTSANRYLEAERPWELARRERSGGVTDIRLDQVLATLVAACRVLVSELGPFLPESVGLLQAQLGSGHRVQPGRPVFAPIAG